jgi:alcohol dehydrogenase YqhD (iron-dependent ADH family)
MRFHSFRTAHKILFGPGVLTQLSEEAKRLGSQKLAVITDPGVTKAGIADKITDVLDHARAYIARNPRHVLEQDMVTLFTNAYEGTLTTQASSN